MREMINFTSNRERRLWIWASVVFVAIYATLFLGGRFISLMVESRAIEQSTFYLFLLLIMSFVISGWKKTAKRSEYWIYAGVFAVLGMAFLRMDLSVAERSHMFEYGLLAILIYHALLERKRNGVKLNIPALIAILIAGSIGLLDEFIQYFIPYRVFDIIDIAFNYLASAFGVLACMLVSYLQVVFTKRFKKKV